MSLDLSLYEGYGSGNFTVERDGDPVLNEIEDRIAARRQAQDDVTAVEAETGHYPELAETSAAVLEPVAVDEMDLPITPEVTNEQSDTSLTTEIKSGRRFPISFDKITLSGVRKAVSKIKNLPMNLQIAMLTSGEIKEETNSEEPAVLGEVRFESQPNRKKRVMLPLGGLAVVGATAYLASRGIHIPSGSRAHETLQQVTPPKVHLPAAEIAQHHPKSGGQIHDATRALELTSTKAAAAKSKIDEITVKPGEGITQTIKDYFPGKSANQYADAYNKLSAKYGSGHIIEGIRKYKMSDGSLGLTHAGKARWGTHVHGFLQNYFKHNK